MALYLAIKEAWRGRGRFLLFSLVIALITILVLFVAALGSGLANAYREYLDNQDFDLLVLQENVDLNFSASQISKSRLNDVRRINGVSQAGLLAFSNGGVLFPDGSEVLDVSLIGVEPGHLGQPALLQGEGLRQKFGDEIVIDEVIAHKHGLGIGDKLTIKTIQAGEDEFFSLRVVGISKEQQFLFLPAVFLPLNTWDEVRPQADPSRSRAVPIGNTIAVQVDAGSDPSLVAQTLEEYLDKVEVVDPETAIEAQPGYGPQQATISTQRGFALLIGVLVVGGFFQIQTMQKLPQIGMLKAIGASNMTVGLAALFQIALVTVVGVLIGGLGVLVFSLFLGDKVPLTFDLATIVTAVTSLLLIGPLGGLVSIRLALRVEPLTAIGLSN